MTRAPHGSAPMFRVMCPKRTGPGGNYPQWMRTLEEKYQKLHRKITENTSMGNTRFTHGLGKSVYDTRLSHVLLKYRDLGSAKPNTKPSLMTKKSGNVPNECDINTGNTEQTLDCKSNTIESCVANDVFDKQTQCLNNNGHTTHSNEGRSSKDDNSSNDGSCNHVITNCDESLEGTEGELEKILSRKDFPEKNSETQKQSAKESVDLNGTNDIVNKTKFILPESHKHNRRNVNTSFSRASKLTSKSCPAQIQSKSAINLRNTETTLLARNKSAHKNSNMFMPMSEEAKHAITETIQEMNISMPSKTYNTKEEVNFIPSRTRKCVKNWTTAKPAKQRIIYNVKTVANKVSKHMDEFNDDGAKQGTSNGEDISLRSSAGSSMQERLPDIQNEGTSDKKQIRNHSYRLPGIGKYDIQQSNSLFEITPPGFDIRYNDIQPVEDRESETPPPDIRQRAVDKCSEWLNKYSK